MNRTVTILPHNLEGHVSSTTVRVFFKEGKRTVKSFKFFNYIGNGDTLTRATCEFIMHGIIPHEEKGLLDVR